MVISYLLNTSGILLKNSYVDEYIKYAPILPDSLVEQYHIAKERKLVGGSESATFGYALRQITDGAQLTLPQEMLARRLILSKALLEKTFENKISLYLKQNQI